MSKTTKGILTGLAVGLVIVEITDDDDDGGFDSLQERVPQRKQY